MGISVEKLRAYNGAVEDLSQKRREALRAIANKEILVQNTASDLHNAHYAVRVAQVEYDEIQKEHALLVSDKCNALATRIATLSLRLEAKQSKLDNVQKRESEQQEKLDSARAELTLANRLLAELERDIQEVEQRIARLS